MELSIPSLGIALVSAKRFKKRFFYQSGPTQSYIDPESRPAVVTTVEAYVTSIGFGIGALILTRDLGAGIKILKEIE